MIIVNKLWWLLGIVVFWCNAIFAVQVQIIEEGHPDYLRAVAFIDEVASIAGEEGVVLKVCLDGWPEVKFSSGKNRIPGSMSPEDFFKEGSFYRESAHLLHVHSFPLDKFRFAMILEKGISGLSQNTGKGVNLFDKLKENYRVLNTTASNAASMGGWSKSALHGYTQTLHDVQQDVAAYIELRMQEEEIWPLCEKLVSTYRFSGGTPPSGTPKSAFEEAEFGIRVAMGSPGHPRIAMFEEEAILPKISPLLPRPGEDLLTVDERELQLRLYCHYWGKHAEDALVYKVLQNLRDCRQTPRVIEIYGNEDPCFQCQVKLQWLADHLAETLGSGSGSSPVTISYYSKGGYLGQCLHVDLPQLVINSFTTRKKEEENKVKKFVFIAGDHSSSPLEVFVAPVRVLRENKLLRPRMLSGQYEGKILEVVSDTSDRVILKIEITSISHATLSYEPYKPGMIPIETDIVAPEELEILRRFYNSKKKVYINLLRETTLSGKQFSRDDVISFKLMNNREDVTQELERMGEGGVFGSGVLT